MKKSKRLKPVLTVAEREESAEAEKFLNTQKNYGAAKQKLDELIAYRTEYLQRDSQHSGQLDLRQFQDNRAFLSKLTEIINIQRTIVDQCEQQMEAQRQVWIGKRQKFQSLDRLTEQYRDQEHKAAERVEQKNSDELNVLRHSWLLRQRIEEAYS